jgi:hypothetical protein
MSGFYVTAEPRDNDMKRERYVNTSGGLLDRETGHFVHPDDKRPLNGAARVRALAADGLDHDPFEYVDNALVADVYAQLHDVVEVDAKVKVKEQIKPSVKAVSDGVTYAA